MGLKTNLAVFFIVLVLLIGLASVVNNNFPNITGFSVHEDEKQVVIVKLKDEKTAGMVIAQYKKNKTQEFEEKKEMINDMQDEVVDDLDMEDKKPIKFETVNAIAIEATQNQIDDLKDDPRVEAVTPETQVSLLLDDSVPLIQADVVHDFRNQNIPLTGKGEAVCIIDTGVDLTHPAFAGRIIAQKCICYKTGTSGCCPGGVNESNNGIDEIWHGTHVSGIAVGNGTKKGVAPEGNLVILKTFGTAGTTSVINIIKAVDWCNNHNAQYNITAISMSLGTGAYFSNETACVNQEPAFASVVNQSIDLGIFVSAASGNAGNPTEVIIPSCFPNVTAVGASTKTDGIWSDTSRGVLMDILAPGASINSARLGGGYLTSSGTSMAAPHAAGAALLLQQYAKSELGRSLSPSEIENALKKTGVDIQGYPRIDVFAALNYIMHGSDQVIVKFNSTDLTNSSRCINASHNFLSVDTGVCPQFASGGNITFLNMTYNEDPIILRDGAVCDNCTLINKTDGKVIFNAPTFSNYTTSANAALEIFDQSDDIGGNISIRSSQYAGFFANYTNFTSGNPINGTCEIYFNITNETKAMQYNLTSGLHEHHERFIVYGNASFEVHCNASGYENLTLIDKFYITPDYAPNATINSPADNARYNPNSNVTFNGTATDIEDGVLNDTSLNWTSSIDGFLGYGNIVWNDSLSKGTHMITLFAKDSANNTANDSIILRISNPSTTTSKHGGGGGGGGGFSQRIAAPTVIPQNGAILNMYPSKPLKLQANGKEVDIRFSVLGRNGIQIAIGPPNLQQRFSIMLGQSTSIDADNDGNPDFKLTLHSVVRYRAQVLVIPLSSAPLAPKQSIITSHVSAEADEQQIEVQEEVKSAPVVEKPVETTIKKNVMEYPTKTKPNYLWYMLPMAGVLLLLFAGFVKYGTTNLVGVSKNMLKMKAYIKTNRAKGYSDRQIKGVLVNYFPEKQIEAAFSEIEETPNIPKPIIK